MITKSELLQAIRECEKSPSNFSACEKLATFYTLYDHLYPGTTTEQVGETIVTINKSDSEFSDAIDGLNADTAWGIMDELMEMLRAVQPRIYNSVMLKIAQSK